MTCLSDRPGIVRAQRIMPWPCPVPKGDRQVLFTVPGCPQAEQRTRRSRSGHWYTPRATGIAVDGVKPDVHDRFGFPFLPSIETKPDDKLSQPPGRMNVLVEAHPLRCEGDVAEWGPHSANGSRGD